jgi:hypothetical protein
MFTYQQNKSTECLPCVAETFKALTQDPETARKIDDVRRLNACGNVAEAKKRKDSLPGCLYQTREVLESIGEAKYNQGKKGRWRLQSQCVLNGLVMCDFDHVEGDPRQIFDSWGLKETTTQTTGTTQTTEAASGVDKSKILLAFITPSGEGLKVVFIADINYNLTDNQKMMAKQLGLTAKIDKGTKDSSRLSYIPKWDDILYMDEEKLFNYDNPLYDEKYGKQYREGNSQGRLDFAEDTAGKTDQAAELTEDLSAINLDENEDGVYCYHGVPYTDILKKWLELTGGTPDIGDRHDRMLGLSGELRRIVNNKPANVLWLMKQVDFYQEFVKEGREKELERMAVDVCKFRPRGAMSEELAQTLDSFGIKYTKLEVQNNLPYDDWADRLLALPLGCYEAALAHVDNPRVKPGAVITASGMYSVLLTRCDYQNWKGDMQRLNSLVLMCGEPASGKAVAKEQDEHIMLTMRESDKPARQAEKAYKKEKNARNTSSKAQKGEALQEPGGIIRYNVVKVSNNRFYKHAENNKETGYDGQQWFLHQYMFSTELLSLINAKGGFQEKRDIMLQAFHNERNGVDYANSDSVNDSMPMMFSGVFTCTRTSLQQFINARNIGDGLSTRMTPWVMPEEDYHTDEYRASRRDKTPAHMMEEWGARFDALKCEIKGLERLVRHVYDLCAALGEEARINEDKVLNLERKRLQDKVMAVCIPQVISTQPSWEEFVKTGVCQIEQHHLDFADLMCEIINRCEDALFGQLLQDMYDNEARDTQLRRVYDKTAKFYSMLPDEFTTQDVQRVWGYSKIVNASQRVSKFVKENVIEMIDRGKYRKLAKAVG